MIKFISITLSAFFLNSLFAQHFIRNIDDQVLVQDKCSQIQKTVEALELWSKKDSCQDIQFEKSSEGQCIADITTCLPDDVKRLVEKSSNRSGPNCWNTALVSAKLIPTIRETSDVEFDLYLKSPLCRQLSPNEKPRTGDIGSIEARSSIGDSFHVHGFIHVGDGIVYNKTGLDVKDRFKLQSYEEMHKNYPVGKLDSECLQECGDVEDISLYFPESYFTNKSVNTKDLPKANILCPLKSNYNALRTLLGSHSRENKMVSSIQYACGEIQKRDIKNKGYCKRVCPLPKKYYYRCQPIERYISLSSLEARNLYKDLVETTNLFEKIAEDYALLGNNEVYENAKDLNQKLLYFSKTFERGFALDLSDMNQKLIMTTIIQRWKGIDSTLKVTNDFNHPLREGFIKVLSGLERN